jgi:hypothetical protein
MRLSRMTTRRWMTAVAVVAVLVWIGIVCHRLANMHVLRKSSDPFDASEMMPSSKAR